MSTIPITAHTSVRQDPRRSFVKEDSAIMPVHGRARWFLPAILLAILVALTLALWRAELRLDSGDGSRSPTWVLWGGLGSSIAFAVATLLVLWQRDQEQQQARRHLAALESLYAISSATSIDIRAGPKVLTQLADSARSLMGMDRAGILLFDTETRLLRLLAASGEMPAEAPDYFPLDHLPACKRCIEGGEVVLSEDVARDQGTANTRILEFFKVGSMILIPLYVADQRIGLMTFSNSGPRLFTPSDRRLAELLGAQASVILANTSLCEEMRGVLLAQKRLLEQREAIAAANVAIYAAPTLRAGLQRLCEIVRPALEVDLCGVVMKSPNGSTLEAATPRIGLEIGETIDGPNSLADEMYSNAAPVIVSDSDTDPRLHPSWRKIRRLGSLLAVPMFDGHRRPLGALVLVRYEKGDFTNGQRELTQILAARAGAAIENSRLLEQTRSDADTKAVLLRELNHRVKNNLAGIVGLLSMGEPEMNPATRHWLDRVIERIRILAGAHELFAGGVATAGLSDLVAKVLPSLSVARPSNVSFHTELNVEARLDPQPAVSLGMVLHELCFNAIVHGMPQGGTLTVRSRPIGADRVAIDVVDTGHRLATVPDPARTGLGLRLVQGLVSRELRGTFTSATREDGGTVATVEFPVRIGPRD